MASGSTDRPPEMAVTTMMIPSSENISPLVSGSIGLSLPAGLGVETLSSLRTLSYSGLEWVGYTPVI